MKTRAEVAELMSDVFEECVNVHAVANKEYAAESNALANFDEVGKDAGVPPERVWYVLASKHWRGIRAWITGFRSQREDVRGRIKDLIVYLVLLYAIIDNQQEEISGR